LAGVLRIVPVALVSGMLFFLSHQEGTSLPLPLLPGLDKLIHAGAYALLAASALFVFSPVHRRKRPLQTAALVILYCSLFALSDEYHQSFVTGRYPSVWDLLADMAGTLVLVIAWLRYHAPAWGRHGG
jgi:VanZ family protein